jgi:hypothetical protein
MLFAERMRGVLKKGVAASKKLAEGLGTKVNDLGNKGAIKIESAALKSRENDLLEMLGGEAYTTLVAMDQASVQRDTPSIRSLLDRISELRARITAMEAEYHAIGAPLDASVQLEKTSS